MSACNGKLTNWPLIKTVMFFLPQAQTRQLLPRVSPWITRSAFKPLLLRKIQTTPETHNDYEAKYADKLRQYAQE